MGEWGIGSGNEGWGMRVGLDGEGFIFSKSKEFCIPHPLKIYGKGCVLGLGKGIGNMERGWE